MNKEQFILQLSAALAGLNQEDLNRSIDYYSEMIDDRIEDGMTEEEAVNALGTVDEIRSRILEDVPMTRIVKEKITPKREFRVGEIILLILGSPVWLPLLLAFIIVCLALYLTFWVIIMSLYVVDLSVMIAGFASFVVGFIQMPIPMTALFFFGSGIALIGLAILLFFGFNQVTKGLWFISKKIALGIKKIFVGGR
jgi:uncharacterized membrane protein